MSITVSPDPLFYIDHSLFGHFLERPSWGGEFGIEDAILDDTGELDPRVMDKIKGLEVPVLRFPGGTDVDYTDWTDMIDLPGRSDRPVSIGNQGDTVTNRFGYDEFAELTAELNCRVIVPLNFFDAYLKRQPLDSAVLHAAGLVAYANADTGQELPAGMPDWPGIRAANGHPEPFDFDCFQIGNETWALWSWKRKLVEQAGIKTNRYSRYIECVRRYIDMIEKIDPDAKIIADYVDDSMMTSLTAILGDRIDYYVFHQYMPWAITNSNIRKHGRKISARHLTQREIWNAFVSVPNKQDHYFMSEIGSPLIDLAKRYDLKIALTEWNWNGWWQSVPLVPLRSQYAHAVGVAGFLHGIMRSADVIEMACQSMLVGSRWGINGIRVDKQSETEPYYLPSCKMTAFYAQHHCDYLLNMTIDNLPTFEQPLKLSGIQAKERVAVVDVLPTGSRDGIAIFLINRHFDKPSRVTLDLFEFANLESKGRLVTLTGVLENSDVHPPKDPWLYEQSQSISLINQSFTLDLCPRSVSVLTFKAKDTANVLERPCPTELELKQNYPNPFNTSCFLEFFLKKSGDISLNIYDIRGRKIRTLINANHAAGKYRISWDGLSDSGESAPSGVYFYRLKKKQMITGKMIKLN
ncbi:MAG: T9SS type A sorting domain-containing protein [candidate division KSB1 bacterium]|nr:T9SS type A sorting domain-containing protein [candidate division KSB1 bacterium]